LLTRAVLYRRLNVVCVDLGKTLKNLVFKALMNILTVVPALLVTRYITFIVLRKHWTG